MADTVNVSGLNSAFNSLANTMLKGRQNGAQRELIRQRGEAAEAAAALTREKTVGEALTNADTRRAAEALPQIAPALADVLYPQIERSYPARPAPVMVRQPYQATPQDGAPYRVVPPAGGIEVQGPTLERVRDIPVTKQSLVSLLAPIVAQGGDVTKMTKSATDMLSTMGILFGNEDLARRGAVAGGMNTGENFAATPGRADQVAARNADAKLSQKNAELDARIEIAKGNNASREAVAAGNREVRREIETLRDGTRREIAVMQDGTRRDLGVLNDGTRREIASQNDATRRDVANQNDVTRRDIANQRDATRRDLRAEGTTGSGKSPLNTPDAVAKFDSLLAQRLDARVGKSGATDDAAKRKLRTRAMELVRGGDDISTAADTAIDEIYGEKPTTQGGGLAGILTGPRTVVPDPAVASRPAASGTTPTARPKGQQAPLPDRAPLQPRGAVAPAQTPSPVTPAPDQPAQPAAPVGRLDEKQVKAEYPDAAFDEQRQRWVVVRDGKTYGVK